MLFVRWPIKNFLGHPGNVANQFVQKKSVSLLGVDRLGASIGKGTWLVVACALWLEEEQEDPIRVEGCGGSMGGIGCDGGGDWKEKGA